MKIILEDIDICACNNVAEYVALLEKIDMLELMAKNLTIPPKPEAFMLRDEEEFQEMKKNMGPGGAYCGFEKVVKC